MLVDTSASLFGRIEEHIFFFIPSVAAGKQHWQNRWRGWYIHPSIHFAGRTYCSINWPHCCVLSLVAICVIVHCHAVQAESGCVDQHGHVSVTWRISDRHHLIRYKASSGSFIGRGGPPRMCQGHGETPALEWLHLFAMTRQRVTDGEINSVCQWVYGHCSEIGRRHSAGAKRL